jgi:multicomponent Na+:H+ antiporter subunit G
MEQARDIVSMVLILAGSAFSVVGGIGILRLPDVFARMHGAGITDTLGAGLILIGLMFQGAGPLVVVKLAMILGFLWITSPTSTHALAKSALAHGEKPKLAGDLARKGGTSSKRS